MVLIITYKLVCNDFFNYDGILYKDINFGYELLPSTENLYWHRVKNLWKIYQSITDDLVYKAMWERKLKELMQRGFDGQ